jgi:hypothetical protein
VNISEVAKNILEDRVCENCVHEQTEILCHKWMGEACGWQYWSKPDEGTCEDWSKDNPHHVADAWVC